jgi:hypothetical protein
MAEVNQNISKEEWMGRFVSVSKKLDIVLGMNNTERGWVRDAGYECPSEEELTRATFNIMIGQLKEVIIILFIILLFLLFAGLGLYSFLYCIDILLYHKTTLPYGWFPVSIYFTLWVIFSFRKARTNLKK